MLAPAGVQEESAGTPGLHATLQRPLGGASKLEKLRRSPGDDPWVLVSAVSAGAGAAAIDTKNSVTFSRARSYASVGGYAHYSTYEVGGRKAM